MLNHFMLFIAVIKNDLLDLSLHCVSGLAAP